MRAGSSERRPMAPPILFARCPGGGGHWWAVVNPRYKTENGHTGRTNGSQIEKWCDEHREEKRAYIARKLSQVTFDRYRVYEQLPLPATRMCVSPNPKSHRLHAVLPSGDFYHRKGAHRIDDTQVEVLDSRCKQCRREEASARRQRDLKENPEGTRRRRRDWQRTARQKVKEDRLRMERETDREVPVEPIREWLIQRVNGVPVVEYAALHGLEYMKLGRLMSDDRVRKVRLSTVDKIGIATGYISLSIDLYPPESEGSNGGSVRGSNGAQRG